MRLLLDECIDRRLMREFTGYNIKTVRIATVDDAGSINYGPLIVETSQPVYDFAFLRKPPSKC